jgi:carbon storage regulator CsrA
MTSEGIVYVLTNPAMPGMVKIGKTSRGMDARLNELYSTGVPLPFECAYAARVSDEGTVERAFHLAFGPYRVNPKREFFSIEPEQAIALLKADTSANAIDCWLTFARETSQVHDPAIDLILGFGVTWDSAFLITRTGEAIAIVGRFDGDNVRIGIEAPKTIPIYRGEIYEEIKAQNLEAIRNPQTSLTKQNLGKLRLAAQAARDAAARKAAEAPKTE